LGHEPHHRPDPQINLATRATGLSASLRHEDPPPGHLPGSPCSRTHRRPRHRPRRPDRTGRRRLQPPGSSPTAGSGLSPPPSSDLHSPAGPLPAGAAGARRQPEPTQDPATRRTTMPKIQRVLVTAVTASVLLAGGTGVAAASPNGQHPDLLETDTYCGPGDALGGRALPVEPAGQPAGGRRGVAGVGPVRGGGAGPCPLTPAMRRVWPWGLLGPHPHPPPRHDQHDT
jgi:hypothetical protein